MFYFTDQLQAVGVGPLPILMPFLQRIRLREIIDDLVPCTNRAEISHGQVMMALVLNRLLSPRALYTLADWSNAVILAESLRLDPRHLNDDRIARTLDAAYLQLEAIQGTLAWQIMESFSLDITFLHWDMTSFFFEGEYSEEDQDQTAPIVNRGFAKAQDSGKSRKQMQVGFATSSDDGVPFWHRAFSGNAAEVSQVADVMVALQKLAEPNSFTLIGDSKLLSRKNIAKALDLGLHFLAPEPRSAEIADSYLHLWQTHALRKLTVQTTRRQEPIYLGFEVPLQYQTEKSSYPLRRIFIVSSEERRATRRSRHRQFRKLKEALDKIRRNLGRYSYTTPERVKAKVADHLAKTDLEGIIRYDVEGTGRDMQLHVNIDEAAHQRLRRLDGVYSLLTSLPPEYDLETVFVRYKRQYLSEHRFANLKGPLRLRPVFIKKNKRIVSLVSVIAIALTVYCLIEHVIRKNLRAQDAALPDLYTGRPVQNPTARRLFLAFEFYNVVRDCSTDPPRYAAPNFNELQQLILKNLEVEDPLSFLA